MADWPDHASEAWFRAIYREEVGINMKKFPLGIDSAYAGYV